MMRVLVATVTAGAGHLAAAEALEEAWRAKRPGDVVERVDLTKFFSPLHRKLYSEGYVKLVQHAPEVWGMLFHRSDNPQLAKTLTRWKRLYPSPSRRRFEKFVAQFQPDAVLCTHFLPVEILGRLRAKAAKATRRIRPRRSKSPNPAAPPLLASIVTDFEAHALWMDPAVDLYCVAAEETRARLIARGGMAENIIATGIPIARKFASAPDPKSARKKLRLNEEQPVVLVLSGGFGMGPVAEILDALDKTDFSLQTVVVTGRNEKLRRELAGVRRRHPTQVLGFASNMHELMAAASLIVTKPGGLTSSEAIALGRPLLILDPIPGQEAANSDFLLEHGAAAKLNRVEDLPFRLPALLGPKRLAAMARAARALGRVEAAKAVCDEVLRRRAE